MDLSRQDQYLIYLTEKGMWDRYYDTTSAINEDMSTDFIYNEVAPRIKTELDTIITKGFSEYFLVLADVMDFCRKQGIAIGPARGSAGGSVVSYCLGITEVDPLQFDLIFERFLNPERTALPDIDVDICWWHRQDVIEYIVEKYGEDRVAQIVTFNTLQPKALLQDVGRVLHIPLNDINRLKSFIPDAEKITLAKLANDEEFMTELHKIADRDDRFIPAIMKLEGLHRNASMHAGGIVITREPITNLAPTFKSGGKGRHIVQYEMMDAESVGALKMDILGLKTVTLVDWAEKDVRSHSDPEFYTRGYRLDDQEAFDIINRGDTAGIFQLEGNGITKFAQEMVVESFNDVVALLALYRPSTLDSGASQQYIDRKNGKEKVTYPHDDLQPILKDTYGIMVYQEQVMFTMGIMCGYSMGQADVMRKAMGKKDEKLMEQELDKFRQLALSPDYGQRAYDSQVVEQIIDLIRTFGRYGFNKSHAVAYAYLTYWTAVIKARYPASFFNAWLNITDDGEKQGRIIDMAMRHDVKILPPSINDSDAMFTQTDPNTIRFGLSAVKGMGKSFVEKTIKSRQANGPFDSYWDYCERLTSIPVDKKEALVGAGAFDHDTEHRGFLYHHARTISECAKKKKSVELTPVPELKPLEMGEMEKQYVNFYITANPIHMVQEELRLMGGVVGVPTTEIRGEPLIGGEIKNIHKLRTKKGDDMAFIDIDDGIVQHSVTLFPQVWKRVALHMKNGEYSAMRCEVGSYRGQPALQAVVVFPIDIKNRSVEMIIDIGTNISMLTLAQLRNILDCAPAGKSTVKILMVHNGMQFLLKSRLYNINVTDDIMGKIRSLLGDDSIKFKV